MVSRRRGDGLLVGPPAPESGLGAGSFERGDAEGFNRPERARKRDAVGGANAVGGRLARRPAQYPARERVRIRTGQMDRGQLLAVGIGRDGHHVRADGAGIAGRDPAALHPPGRGCKRPAR